MKPQALQEAVRGSGSRERSERGGAILVYEALTY
jgi:hypothetical protein